MTSRARLYFLTISIGTDCSLHLAICHLIPLDIQSTEIRLVRGFVKFVLAVA